MGFLDRFIASVNFSILPLLSCYFVVERVVGGGGITCVLIAI